VYYVSVRLAGDGQEAEWYDDVNQFSEATPITIDYDLAANNIDFDLMLGAAGGISGLVTDSSSSPLPDKRVVVWQNVGGEPEFIDYGLTNSNGVFQIGGASWNFLEEGQYYLSLTMPGQGLYPSGWYDGAESFETATPVTVNEGSVTTDIHLTEASVALGTISGTVTWDDEGDPVENAEVMVMIQGRYAYWQGTETDENGNYPLHSPPTSGAIVYVAHPYFGGIVEFNGDVTTPDEALVENVEVGQTTTVDFGIADYFENAYISGTITSTGGSTNFGSVQLFHVNDRDKPAKSFFIGSGQQVQFNKFIMPGAYVMMADGLSSDGVRALNFYDETFNPMAATAFEIAADDFIGDMDFTLDYTNWNTISGNVANADGSIEKARVFAVFYANQTDEWVTGAITDIDGNYTLNVPEGHYFIMVLGKDGVPIFYGEEINWTLAPVIFAGTDNVDFMLPITADAHGTSISGTINADGEPLPYVRVYAFDDFGPAAYAITDTEGNYTLHGLQPEMRYTIQANRFGYFHANYVQKIMLSPWVTLTGIDMELVVCDLEPLEIYGDEDQTSGGIDFALFQNYPNPFNPSTTISFQLPEADRVTIDIFNVAGQRVKRLVDTNYDAGLHQLQWKGGNELGLSTGSGIYYYQIRTTSGLNDVKRMVMLK
ncbi:MAG: T9SS type A sorting domain-containing protein, partial [Planctomycetes bacterium]|nr:T9SS type A sorting domain-containing protein [Planctomycetota bacterium]